MSRSVVTTLSIDPKLLDEVDRARARAHAAEPRPKTQTRAALIAHLLSEWLSNLPGQSVLALEAVPAEAPTPVPAEPPAAAQKSLRQTIFDLLELDPSTWLYFDELRAILRRQFPYLTMRDLKDELTLMIRDELIVAERETSRGARGVGMKYGSRTDLETFEPCAEAVRLGLAPARVTPNGSESSTGG